MALQDAKAAKILVNDDVIIDVTYTTATEEAVFDGRTFLGADGRVVTGTLQIPLSYMANGGIAYIEKGCSTMHRNNSINVIEQNDTDFPCITEASLDNFDSFSYAEFNRKPVLGEYFLVHTLDKDLHIVSFLGQVTSLDDEDQTFEYAIVFMNNDAEAEALQVIYSDADTSGATTSDTKRPGNNGAVDFSDKTASDLIQSFLSSTVLTFNARVFNRAPRANEYFSFVAKTKDAQLLSIFAQITEVPLSAGTTYKYKILALPDIPIGFVGVGEHAEIFNDYINNTAAGNYSHAEGYQTTASGTGAHAEGYQTTALKDGAHAEGYSTTAEGTVAHAEGYGTGALGAYSHVEGYSTATISTATAAHAEGEETQAQAPRAHAEGYHSIAAGEASHAEGYMTSTNASAAHSEGLGTQARGEAQHVQGKFNIVDNTSAHIVGNGENINDRSNAHTLDWSGNAWFAGDVYVGCTATTNTNKDDGSKKLATEEIAQQKADTALADAKAYTDETKNALLGTEELVGTYDTLKEIGAWIANSGVDATELTSAIAGEAAAREAADGNLSQQLTTMEAAIAGHTQSISDLSSGLEGLGNVLEDNYYSKSEIDQKLQDLPSSGGGGNTPITIDTDFSFESQNPVTNKTITSTLSLLKTPVYTFDSVSHIYNYLGNMDAVNDIFDKNTIIRVKYNQQTYYCIVVSKNEGWQETDYVPTNMDVLFGDMEGSFFAPGTITCFETLGYKGYEAYWRIAVLPQTNEYYTPDIIDEKIAECAKYLDLNNYVTASDVEQICKEELVGHGVEYQVKGNTRSATPLITEEGKYYWLRQISTGQDLCGLWWPDKDISSLADITFSEMEFVCANGVGFLGYRYRASNAENWTYGKTSVPSGTAIMLGPGTIVQITPVALI